MIDNMLHYFHAIILLDVGLGAVLTYCFQSTLSNNTLTTLKKGIEFLLLQNLKLKDDTAIYFMPDAKYHQMRNRCAMY